ncbi:MAG: pentapeptide repeat-containing protein [Thermomicrobiales bacterium]
MDRGRFDALARLIRTTKSAVELLGWFSSGSMSPAAASWTKPHSRRNEEIPERRAGRRGRAHGRDKDSRKPATAEAVPASCFTGTNCSPAPGANLKKCDFGGQTIENLNLSGSNLKGANLANADASGANFAKANLDGACLVEADLSGANLTGANTSGAIFCRTIMPNGSINNSGCGTATSCCPTCQEIGGACGDPLGGACCDGAVCINNVCTCPANKPKNCDGACRECCDETDCGGDTPNCCNGKCRACCADGDCSDEADNCNTNGVCKCGSGPACTGGTVCESGACVIRVTPANLNGWFFYNDETDQIDNSLGSYVSGPGSPKFGDGSARISVTGTQRRNLATYQFSGVKLANITQLKFRTYNPSAGNGGSSNRSAYLNFNVDFNGSDTWQRRLAFVPNQNGVVTPDTWKEWDAINGGGAKWSYSGATWPGGAVPGTTLKTWSQILSEYPGIRIRVTDSWLGLRVGEPYANGYTENIDSFTFATASSTKIFDFDPDS